MYAELKMSSQLAPLRASLTNMNLKWFWSLVPNVSFFLNHNTCTCLFTRWLCLRLQAEGKRTYSVMIIRTIAALLKWSSNEE